MKKVLVVDDADDIRENVVRALKEEGYETLEADNGASAFTLAKNHIPDLIISDVIMDSGSGFVLHELLRDDPQTAAIPMILMTGIAEHAGAWGSDPDVEYLAKPFGVRQLIAIVSQKLGTASQDHGERPA